MPLILSVWPEPRASHDARNGAIAVDALFSRSKAFYIVVPAKAGTHGGNGHVLRLSARKPATGYLVCRGDLRPGAGCMAAQKQGGPWIHIEVWSGSPSVVRSS